MKKILLFSVLSLFTIYGCFGPDPIDPCSKDQECVYATRMLDKQALSIEATKDELYKIRADDGFQRMDNWTPRKLEMYNELLGRLNRLTEERQKMVESLLRVPGKPKDENLGPTMPPPTESLEGNNIDKINTENP